MRHTVDMISEELSKEVTDPNQWWETRAKRNDYCHQLWTSKLPGSKSEKFVFVVKNYRCARPGTPSFYVSKSDHMAQRGTPAKDQVLKSSLFELRC